MNILVLNGSPRPNGNIQQMTEAFREGAEEAGNTVTVADVCRKQWQDVSHVSIAIRSIPVSASRKMTCRRSMHF